MALATTLLPALLVSHARDPEALVLRSPWLVADCVQTGAWAGKIGSHEAHHRFGSLGRQRHLQVNVWRVGVKGSGVSYRLPLVAPLRALSLVTQMLA